MTRPVEIHFDCLPLRTLPRIDVPVDASPKYREKCMRIKDAIERHGFHNTYYLHNAGCTFRLTNQPNIGMIEFTFEGTVFTDASDQKTERCDLIVKLVRETCDWLKEPIVAWFMETVRQAVVAEFDRYIAAGDLERARKRLAELQAKADQAGGYVGMYL